MSLRSELAQILFDLFGQDSLGRAEIAHFCAHDGIRIGFTRARTTWLSSTPSGIRPWCIVLEPLRGQRKVRDNNRHNNNTEVTENA